MKHIFLFVTLLVVCFSFTQDDNLIAWQETSKLSWTDFKAKPNT